MSRFSSPVILLILFAAAGCQNSPFNVVAPSFSSQTGSAVVSVQIPPYSRGLIQRVSLQITAADTGQMSTIRRDMNFPNPGGNIASGQVADIPAGLRRFTVTAYDTTDISAVPRFRGVADSVVIPGQTQFVHMQMKRIGGTVNFLATIDTTSAIMDSSSLAKLPLTSVLDILELLPQSYQSAAARLPLASVGVGTQFSMSGGVFSREVTIAQIPTGTRRFVVNLKDLSSNETRAFTDTVVVKVDTAQVANAVLALKRVQTLAGLDAVFRQPTLPPDSTVIVITPQF